MPTWPDQPGGQSGQASQDSQASRAAGSPIFPSRFPEKTIKAKHLYNKYVSIWEKQGRIRWENCFLGTRVFSFSVGESEANFARLHDHIEHIYKKIKLKKWKWKIQGHVSEVCNAHKGRAEVMWLPLCCTFAVVYKWMHKSTDVIHSSNLLSLIELSPLT